MQSSDFQDIYERFKKLCVGPSVEPRITIASLAIGYRSGKSLSYDMFLSGMVSEGFTYYPVGTFDDHSQAALVLRQSKERKQEQKPNVPFTFTLGYLLAMAGTTGTLWPSH